MVEFFNGNKGLSESECKQVLKTLKSHEMESFKRQIPIEVKKRLAVLDPYSVDNFTRSYIGTALWSTRDGDTYEDLDDNYDLEDLADETIITIVEDCANFQIENEKLIEQCDQDEEKCGQDFWLTRNGHGAGFWDGDYGDELGDELTKQSEKYGELDLYPGDDGKLYF